jgi:hypothetical protein
MTQDQAQAIAAPHLGKPDVQVVYVNQHGLYWINNSPEQMAEYFEGKKESYFTFTNEEQTDESQPIKKGKKK